MSDVSIFRTWSTADLIMWGLIKSHAKDSVEATSAKHCRDELMRRLPWKPAQTPSNEQT